MIRSLFVLEDYMGHATHGRFLRHHLAHDPRFDATVVLLPRAMAPRYPLALVKAKVPGLDRYGIDLLGLRQFLYRQIQVRRAVAHIDRSSIDLLFVHTQTVARNIRELFPSATIVISIDSTWLQVTGESRYAATPFFGPVRAEERRVLEQGDAIVSWSQWAAEAVTGEYRIDPGKVRVIHHGVTLPPAQPVHAEPGRVHLGFVGNDFVRKGGNVLLRVHQTQLWERAHLTIVTSDRVDTRGLKNVTVRQHIPWHDLVTSVMPAFDIYIHPSMFDYSPLAILEARMLGLPVIAGRVGAIPEMIRDGIDGILLAMVDEASLAAAIQSLIEHPERALEMGARAQTHVRAEFNAEHNYPLLLNHLAALASSGGRW